ncbi:DUF445 domain-containing protein [Aliikangiella sp. IMCC44653]
MNKSMLTNLIALILLSLGYIFDSTLTLCAGLFALSGALTNWLAIHMLFEKVPGLYGSGVIPARFQEFKLAIKNMMMQEFFNQQNIDHFLTSSQGFQPQKQLTPIIEKIDLEPAFERLVKVIMESSFGGMLGMFGGQEALLPLKEPFAKNMRESIIEMISSEEFSALLIEEIEDPESLLDIRSSIESIIEGRLNQLTPQLVKEIVQNMIKNHLGWLVVWGGVFGGLIGLVSAITINL